MDRIFRKFGLSGKSFIPMLIGSGCGVPGIMASRTIENDRDRKMTIMTTTFIPCGAKLPIIALIAGALFDGAAWVAPSAYFVGIAAVICSGIILKKTRLFAGDPAPFVMELPAYHMPTVGNVMRSTWERGWSFVKKAGTIILVSTILLWFLMSFGWADGSFGMLADGQLDSSILAAAGNLLAPLFAPLGWGDWRMAVAAVTGLIAKENVVGTFGILFGCGRGWNRDLGTACGKHDSNSGLFLPCVQSFVCSLLCCDGSNQARDEQCKMVLVCNRIPDASGIYCFSLRLPVWICVVGGKLWNRDGGSGSFCNWIHLSAGAAL